MLHEAMDARLQLAAASNLNLTVQLQTLDCRNQLAKLCRQVIELVARHREQRGRPTRRHCFTPTKSHRFFFCSFTRPSSADSRCSSASNARMHPSLVACGLSAVANPHDGHTATTCDLKTSGFSTVHAPWSNSFAAENSRYSR
jgi:hypothetical protein